METETNIPDNKAEQPDSNRSDTTTTDESKATQAHLEIEDTIIKRLKIANREELEQIAELCGVGDAKSKTNDQLVLETSAKLRFHASSWVMSIFRSKHSFPYKRLLIDVADKVSEGYTVFSWTPFEMSDDYSEMDIEDYIWQECERMVRQEIRGLSKDKQQLLQEEVTATMIQRGLQGEALKAFSAAGVSMLIGSIVTQMIVLRVLFGAGSRQLLTLFGVEASTGVGIVIAAISVLAVLQGTSYRITIPASIRLISIRKRADMDSRIKALSLQPLKAWDLRDELKPYETLSLRTAKKPVQDQPPTAGMENVPESEATTDQEAAPAAIGLRREISAIREQMLTAPWFSREQVLMDALAKKDLALTCDEACALIELLIFTTAKREAILAAQPLLTDPENIREKLIDVVLLDNFDRMAVLEELHKTERDRFITSRATFRPYN